MMTNRLFGSGWLKKILITLLLVPALIYLTKVGVADFLRLAPCAYLEAVQKGGVPLDPVKLAVARERLLLARSWDASNPVIPEFIGHIAYMRAQSGYFTPRRQAVFLQEAIDEFEQAIKLRPNSAYLWAARMTMGSLLIDVNVQAGSNDDALLKRELRAITMAMHRAAVLGPWEQPVLRQIVKVGTSRYQDLSVGEQELVDEAVTRAKRLNLKI
ncbi:MAG: hypothetical protein Q8L80_01855 [Gallionella sp.]|nr:hypothetical protein [Gallionella sp.]MDP1939745.1 hypothetical protein [Gallionella sp.]